MAYIFLDESGDLGFNFKKRGTSNFFVITLLFIEGSKGPIEKIIKKTHSQLAKKFKRRIGVLHAVYEKKIISSDKSIELIASRRETNKFLNENFKDYLRRQVKSIHKGTIQISIKTPVEESSLFP